MDFKALNYGTSAVRTSEDAGQLTYNRFVFDLANAAYRPAVVAIADGIVVGVVPAGELLLPWLSRLDIPQIDTTANGQASLGTIAVPAALKAAGVVNAAQLMTGEDFLTPAAVIGSRTVDTLIVLRFTVGVTTLAASGKIIGQFVTRPWDVATDG